MFLQNPEVLFVCVLTESTGVFCVLTESTGVFCLGSHLIHSCFFFVFSQNPPVFSVCVITESTVFFVCSH